MEGLEEFGSRDQWNLLRTKGILLEPLYKEAWGSYGVDTGGIIELLLHCRLAADIVVPSDVHVLVGFVRSIFIPALLPYNANPSPIAYEIHDRATPLHITFTTQFVPPGYFIRLVATLASQKNWIVLFPSSGTYRNHLTFRYDKVDHVTVSEAQHSIKVELIRCVPSDPALQSFPSTCHQVLLDLVQCRKEVEQCLGWSKDQQTSSDVERSGPIPYYEGRSLPFKSKFSFICSAPSCKSSEEHYVDMGQYLYCKECSEYYRPSQTDKYWIHDTPSKLVSGRLDLLLLLIILILTIFQEAVQTTSANVSSSAQSSDPDFEVSSYSLQ